MKWLILIVFLLPLMELQAHPVSYGRSLSLTSHNNKNRSHNTIHYSPTYWWSYGVEVHSDRETKIFLPRVGFLVKRWNGDDYQANIYAFGGYGYIDWDQSQGKKSDVYRVGTQLDWETRKIFTLAKYARYEGTDFLKENYMVRLGFAPYLAKYNELNTWLMLQLSHQPHSQMSQTSVTPLIRMFYKNVLWEFGASTSGNWLVNFTIRQFI